ncbi:MAG: (Fe-S)-binding protein [Desulfobacula sp.]|nr:(Fe-S)-binding protein [Desulfobacula sp.]
MSDIKKLAQSFTELEEQLIVCIRCGMCQSVCPVFEQTHKEADVARGKLALLSGLMNTMFDDPGGVSNRLNKCLLCGSCAANCPSGVNALEIFIKARTILAEYMGLSPIKKIIFKHMLSKPRLFNSLMSMAEKFQPLISLKKSETQGTSCARFDLPLMGHRHFRALAKEPFHHSFQKTVLKTKVSKIRIALFTGCLIDKILPEIAHAVVKTTVHHDIELVIPDNQGCCGIPALASGDRTSFNSLVEHHVKLFDPKRFDYLVTACATCTSTIKKFWPSLGTDIDPCLKRQLAQLSSKTLDINQFLVDVAGIPLKKKTPGKDAKAIITYHDPCHLKKSLGVHKQPRQLITASGYQLKEMAGSDRCCGMGGSFNLFHYDISTSIGKLKQQNIMDTGCNTIATGCPACIMQISDMLSKEGALINVKHPVELYAETL